MRSEDNTFLLIWLTCSMGAITITPVKATITTSCSIPSVEEGQQTILTCTFSEDISNTQQDFKVVHYNMKSMEVTETVLECIWFNGKLECEPHSCCLFDNTVTFNLSLVILNATRDREGRYMCFALPSSPGTTEFCHFTLKKSLTKAGDNGSSSFPIAAVIVGIILLAAVIVIIVILLVCRKRCYDWIQKKKNTTDADHSTTGVNYKPQTLTPDSTVKITQKESESHCLLEKTEPTSHHSQAGVRDGSSITDSDSETKYTNNQRKEDGIETESESEETFYEALSDPPTAK